MNKNQLIGDECATNQKQYQEQEPPSEFKDKGKVSAIKRHRLGIYPMKTFLKLAFNNGCPLSSLSLDKEQAIGAFITGIQDRFMQAISAVLS